MDDRAVAVQAGAVAFLCSHHNSVHLSTVQVVPGAGGGVGETPVGVAVKPSCNGNICFGAVTGPPADRAHVELTLHRGCHVAGDTWSWGEKGGGELKYTQACDRSCASCVLWCEIEDHTCFEEGRAAGDAVTLAALSLYSDIVVLSTR